MRTGSRTSRKTLPASGANGARAATPGGDTAPAAPPHSDDRGRGRPVNSDSRETWRTIQAVGIRLLHKHGYEAMNLRQLATAANLKPASLYNYFSSKNEFLAKVVTGIMDKVLLRLMERVAPIQDPVERLRAFVAFHVDWSIHQRAESVVGLSEMRYLAPRDLAHCIEQRKQYSDFVTAILDRGVAAGVFSIPNTRITTFAILAMVGNVHVWHRPTGRLTSRQIAEIYVDLIFNMVRAVVPGLPATPA